VLLSAAWGLGVAWFHRAFVHATVIGVVLARADLMAAAYAQIEEDFSDPEAQLLWGALAAQYERRHELDLDEIFSAFADHPAVIDRLTRMRMENLLEAKLSLDGFRDLLLRLRRARLKRQVDALNRRLKAAEAGNDREEVKRLLAEDRGLQKQLSGG